MKKIYIIAGEASGDNIGAKLIDSIRKAAPDSVIQGIGGENMQSKNFKSLFPINDIAVMGFVEVLPHIPKIMTRIKQAIQDIKSFKPDLIITIDSPGFNFRVVEQLRKNGYKKGYGVKIIHYVAPTVWAYKPERAKKCADLFDLMLCILPFEPEYFEKEGLKAIFVGHPSTEDFMSITPEPVRSEVHKIAIMLGSRKGEIKRHFQIMQKLVEMIHNQRPNIEFIFPTLAKHKLMIEGLISKQHYKYSITDDKITDISGIDLAIAKSGTVNMELSLKGIPYVTFYKANPISAWFVKRLIKIKYVNIINIIADKEIVPEFIQSNCNHEKIYQTIDSMLNNHEIRLRQVKEVQKITSTLRVANELKPSELAAKEIL